MMKLTVVDNLLAVKPLRQIRENGLRDFIYHVLTSRRGAPGIEGTNLNFQFASLGAKSDDPLTVVCCDAAGAVRKYRVTITEVV